VHGDVAILEEAAERIFEDLHRFFQDDAEQISLYQDQLKDRIRNGPDVDSMARRDRVVRHNHHKPHPPKWVHDLAYLDRHAAFCSLMPGRNPARCASRTSMPRLNRLIFPLLISDTRARVMPSCSQAKRPRAPLLKSRLLFHRFTRVVCQSSEPRWRPPLYVANSPLHVTHSGPLPLLIVRSADRLGQSQAGAQRVPPTGAHLKAMLILRLSPSCRA
jgi:hypothetical protein